MPIYTILINNRWVDISPACMRFKNGRYRSSLCKNIKGRNKYGKQVVPCFVGSTYPHRDAISLFLTQPTNQPCDKRKAVSKVKVTLNLTNKCGQNEVKFL